MLFEVKIFIFFSHNHRNVVIGNASRGHIIQLPAQSRTTAPDQVSHGFV